MRRAFFRSYLGPDAGVELVVLEIRIQRFLHLFYRLVPRWSALNAEVLVEQSPVQELHKNVRLRATNLGFAMFCLVEFQMYSIGMGRGAALFLPIVREDH